MLSVLVGLGLGETVGGDGGIDEGREKCGPVGDTYV